MEGLLKQLNFYGPVIIRRFNNTYWHCYCEVRLFEHSDIKQVVHETGNKLYEVLRELLKKSAIAKKQLVDKQKEPKQEALNYGSTNKNCEDIA